MRRTGWVIIIVIFCFFWCNTLQAQNAHEVHLKDRVDYLEWPEYPFKYDTAVVGNKSTLFYPDAHLEDGQDLSTLSEGILLPFGEVIPIIDRIENQDGMYGALFNFGGHLNFFYKTRWHNQKGLIFGADLSGLQRNLSMNTMTALTYKSNGLFNEFPPFSGYHMLSEGILDRIQKDRLAFQEVRPDEYRLSLKRPDDMISLYMNEADQKLSTVFITTDLFANSLHLFFNQYLQYVEENHFIPGLARLVDSYIEKLVELEKENTDLVKDSVYTSTLKLAQAYFQTAQALIALAPDRVEQPSKIGGKSVAYQPKDTRMVLAGFPDAVVQEIKLILDHNKYEKSPNFNYMEDYTQFKPRGHYTKNGVLEAYFRTMMWFGRLHIYMSTGKLQSDQGDMGVPKGPTAMALSRKLMPVAMLITSINTENEEIHRQWESLFKPVTRLIGMSDDLSFHDTIPFFKSLKIADFSKWVASDKNIIHALNKAHKELRLPLIAGNSVFQAPSGNENKPPMGWRLFGQRFTYDSFIHTQVSTPRLKDRNIVRGLDIMTVFGSKTADSLLRHSDYPKIPQLEKKLYDLKLGFEGMEPDIWTKTYYNRVLEMIKAQALFEPGAGFFFTETPAWGIKSQLSAHGTWAALRHDTILYVKQVYSALKTGASFDPTFRTLDLPEPVHYLEPNPDFFDSALASIEELEQLTHEFNLGSDIFNPRLQAWKTILKRCISIIAKEKANQHVSKKDIQWLPSIPFHMAGLVLPPEAKRIKSMAHPESLKGAIIADVYTNTRFKQALEVGTGIPYRIYVALNDRQGKKRIAVGYTFSYYEFMVSQSQRMNTQEWQKLVYTSNPELSGKKPFWSKEIALPPKQKVK